MKFTSAQTLRVWGCEGKEDRDDGGRLSVLAWVIMTEGAFCCPGKRNVAWMPLERGDSRFCFGQIEFEGVSG